MLWRFNDSFTMLHKSKTAEIDRVLKKVDEGADFFDEIWAKGMCFGYRSFELVIRAYRHSKNMQRSNIIVRYILLNMLSTKRRNTKFKRKA